jgi:hypothetical protein
LKIKENLEGKISRGIRIYDIKIKLKEGRCENADCIQMAHDSFSAV